MAALGFMGVMGTLASASAGFNAHNQQAEIKQNFCELYDKVKQYKTLMGDESRMLDQADAEAKSKVQDLTDEIRTLKQQIDLQHLQFKKTYNTWVVIGFIFVILLVFIFASKKIILRSSTER